MTKDLACMNAKMILSDNGESRGPISKSEIRVGGDVLFLLGDHNLCRSLAKSNEAQST